MFLLVLFLARPRVGRLGGRVAQAIAQGLGRQVEISAVHLRLFPRPGFELDDLVVHDDPSFGTEPLVRAPDVTAWIRVGGLLRGRIEISSLSLSEASLNLTRNEHGKWNLEDLIERTSHTALAPTSASRQQYRASFPYIQATKARINFKIGSEKTHFALTDAEFALWQDSADTWGARLKAAPIRTDANLTDTGLINVNGTWRRSVEARHTPLQISFEWKQAQVGQLSKLVYGSDREWRGGMTLSGTASGTPAALRVVADASLDDLRRREVLAGEDLRLAAHCGAEFNLPSRIMSEMDCVAPAKAGFLELKGNASGPGEPLSPFSTYDLHLIGSKVPANVLLDFARDANLHFSPDLVANGVVDGDIEVSRENESAPRRLQLAGVARELTLNPSQGGTIVALGTVSFASTNAKATDIPTTSSVKKSKKAVPNGNRVQAGVTQILVGPINLAATKTESLQAGAILSVNDYKISISGDAGVKHLLQLARVFNVPSPTASADGNVNAKLTIEGSWSGEKPAVLGSAQLRSVRAQVRGLNAPIEIANANLTIMPDAVRVQNLTAQAAGATWHGSLVIPRPCAPPNDCTFEFNLRTPELNAASLNALVNPELAKTSWYRILSLGANQAPFLVQARAAGTVAIDKLLLGTTSCSHFASDLKLDAGEITLSNFHGDLFNGNATGVVKTNFIHKSPQLSGTATLKNIDLAQIATLTHDAWIEGIGTAKLNFSASGRNLQEILKSADLRSSFEINDGVFPHIVLTGTSGPMRANLFSGKLHLQEENFSFDDTKLEGTGAVYAVSGTASLNGVLSLKMSNENSGFNLTGTVLKTRVSAIPAAEIALK